MTTFIQLHVLTFVPPANLNRDDTGAPKTAIVGGDLRLRLSSQSLKRAWRTSEAFEKRLKGHLGTRSKRFGDEIRTRIAGKVNEAQALAITQKVISVFGTPEDGKGETKTGRTKELAFLSPTEMMAAQELADRLVNGETIDDKKYADLVLKRADTAADIAMFGRMFASQPAFNREAAVQVAHAITTHRVAVEDDFFTAVDDLNTGEEDAGAGHVGGTGFGSGLFYIYLCIDTAQLVRNLGGDAELARAAVTALVEATALVLPSGKQNSFAAHGRAHFMLAEKGSAQPRTLAGAIAKAIPEREAGEKSHKELLDLREKYARAYGAGDMTEYKLSVLDGLGTLEELMAFASDWKV